MYSRLRKKDDESSESENSSGSDSDASEQPKGGKAKGFAYDSSGKFYAMYFSICI
jgi:hypothetical protein